MTKNDLIRLLKEWNYQESELSEFKTNNKDPNRIGSTIAALSNSASLSKQDVGYLIFGISDQGEIIGTKFNPNRKLNNQEFKNWLSSLLDPSINFEIHSLKIDNKTIVVFKVFATSTYPVKFKKITYIRVGATTKPLNQHPELEKILWQTLNTTNFEEEIALDQLSQTDILNKLNYVEYFKIANNQTQSSFLKPKLVLERFEQAKFIKKQNHQYAITNLGGLLLANDINDFGHNVNYKIPRLIFYKDTNRFQVLREATFNEGYVTLIPKLIDLLSNLLPSNEEIEGIFRQTISQYPIEALRELIVNCLMHQDFSVGGMQPMIEIFTDRIEIRNPGIPSIDVERFVDSAPMCRNTGLARAMRFLKFCEERGSGIDKAVGLCEIHKLPAPKFKVNTHSTTAILYPLNQFSKMRKEDKIWATYLHACLKQVNNDFMTNKSLRERFNISSQNYTQASKIIKYTLDEGLIKKYDQSSSPRNTRYIPIWA